MMLLPSKSCASSAKNNQVQRPNILCWIFALRTLFADVICAGKLTCLLIIITIFAGCATSSGTIYEDTVAAESSKSTGAGDEQYSPENEKQGLEILSDPEDAAVYLNNDFAGTTPLMIEGISQGRYRVTIVKQGYYEHNNWINYYSDHLIYHADLEAITGFIMVNADQQNAEISVGDQHISSGNNIKIPIGRYQVMVRAFGYEDYSTAVQITEGALTSLSVKLEKAEFNLSPLALSRNAFNPANFGSLGKARISFDVTAPGSATVLIVEKATGAEVGSFSLGPFTTWEQSFEWDGRRSDGGTLPDGGYQIIVKALAAQPAADPVAESGPAPLSHQFIEQALIRLDSSIIITYRSLWNGSSGLLYAPSPEVLPWPDMQLSSLVLVHVEPNNGDYSYRAPWNLGLRLGLKNNLEFTALVGFIAGYYQDIPLYAAASLKSPVFAAGQNPGIESAALIKLSYQQVTTDTMADFTGLSGGFPLRLKLSSFSILLSPEIIISPWQVSYSDSGRQEPFPYVWMYGKGGILFDSGPVVAGLSVAFRSIPFSQGFQLDLPFQSAAELHLLLPGTQLFLSLAAAGEFRSMDDFYLMTGGGLGLLF